MTESNAPMTHNDDEIDLRELVRALWETRVPVALAVISFTALFWLAMMALGARSGVVYSWDAQVQFTFSGVNEGQYPGGEPFSNTDLLSPVVLGRVYDLNDLESHGISRSAFFDALSVTSHAPNRDFIVRRFRDQLEGRSLSSAELRQIEEEFASALRQASRGQAILTLTLRDRLTSRTPMLPDAVARKVLLDIPRVWARYATEETGLFAADISLFSVDVLDSSVYRDMDFLMAYDAIREKFGLLRSNLDEMASLRNSNTVRDPITGYRLSDVRALMAELEDFVLEEALAPSITTGVSRNPELVMRFFGNRIEDLERRRNLLETRARRVEQALADYMMSPQSGLDVSGVVPRLSPPDGSGLGSATTIPQFGSDFLDRLVQLGSDSGDVQFRQELSRERLDYLLEAADLSAEISRLKQMIDMIEAERRNEGRLPQGSLTELADLLSERMDEVVEQLRAQFLVADRIADRLGELRFGSQEAIYNIAQAPLEASTSTMVLTRSNLQRFVLGAFLIAILAVFAVFLSNMLRSTNKPAA